MADLEVVIVDSGGYRFNQRLDNYMAMRALVPLLATRLGLPEELNYQLIPRRTGRPMLVTDTLASIGAAAGAEIEIRPVRDDAFARFLDYLYKKAKKYVMEQLWDKAKQELDLLFRLDPRHADPERLRDRIEANGGGTLPVPPSTPGPQPQTAVAAQTSNTGCWMIFVIVAIIVVFAWKPWTQSNSGKQKQTKGSFTAEMVRAGNSYYFTVTSKTSENIQVSVQGTDSYQKSFQGRGSLRTDTIPKGNPGVIDTITVRSLNSGETETFTFRFQ